MSTPLGTVADLPADYYDGLVSRNLLPLWPSLRSVLPYGKPSRRTQPTLWKYDDVRPNLLRAGELAPIEKAERRVLVLCNPGLGLANMQATPSIYVECSSSFPGRRRRITGTRRWRSASSSRARAATPSSRARSCRWTAAT